MRHAAASGTSHFTRVGRLALCVTGAYCPNRGLTTELKIDPERVGR